MSIALQRSSSDEAIKRTGLDMDPPPRWLFETPTEGRDGNNSSSSSSSNEESGEDDDYKRPVAPLAPRPSQKRSSDTMIYAPLDPITMPDLDAPMGKPLVFKPTSKPRRKILAAPRPIRARPPSAGPNFC